MNNDADVFNGVLIKVGQEEHLKRLRQEGMLHCNTLDYFANIEDGGRRGDKLENVTHFFNAGGDWQLEIAAVDTPEKKLRIKIDKAHFRASHQAINLFCLYSVDMKDFEPGKRIQLEPRFADEKWGTHFIIIYEAKTFINRLAESLKTQQYSCMKGFVRYKDLSTSEEENDGYLKDIQYAYQKEFRLRFANNEVKDIDIFIGDISEITTPPIPIKQLPTLPMKYGYK